MLNPKIRRCITIDNELSEKAEKSRGYISWSAYVSTAIAEKIERDSI
jgi:post-segregation antitoxin (ccd killing protein)